MFIFLLIALGVVLFGSWLYAIIEIISDDYKSDTDKLLWFLLVFFLPFVGTIVYFLIGRDKVSLPPEKEYV